METSWDALKRISEQGDDQRPSVGRMVRVVKGRKHVGEVGLVTWHGKDKYCDLDRYKSPIQVAMADVVGRTGYRIRISPDDGAAFFVCADYVEVISST